MQLTPEQQSLIPVYIDKWRKIAFSTERIEKSRAIQAVKSVYALIQQPEPEVTFFESPKAALKAFRHRRTDFLSSIQQKLQDGLRIHLLEQLDGSSEQVQIIRQLREPLERSIWEQFVWKIQDELGRVFSNYLNLAELACHGSYFDFLISVVDCSVDTAWWEAFQSLLTECGWIFPFENICGVCERPISISFDENGLLHQEGEAAIKFVDGFGVYSYHGISLPEKYGKLHPSQWEPEWLLKEQDNDLKKVLFQSVDYLKVCQRFPTTELDVWENCTLLKIDQEINGERVHVLRVEESNDTVYAARVSSYLKTARAAFLELGREC